MPQIAKVAVSAANYAIDKPYDYLLPDGTDAADIAASIGAWLGTKLAVYYLPAPDGEPYLAAIPGEIPSDCVWNITFD